MSEQTKQRTTLIGGALDASADSQKQTPSNGGEGVTWEGEPVMVDGEPVTVGTEDN